MGICNTLYVKRLQNSIAYIRYTILQLTEFHYITETHLSIISGEHTKHEQGK